MGSTEYLKVLLALLQGVIVIALCAAMLFSGLIVEPLHSIIIILSILFGAGAVILISLMMSELKNDN